MQPLHRRLKGLSNPAERLFSDETFALTERAADELIRRRPALLRELRRYGSPDELRMYVARWLFRDVALLLTLADGGSPVDVSARRTELAFLAGLVGIDLQLGRESRARNVVATARVVTRLWSDWLTRLRPRGWTARPRALLLRHYAEDWSIDVAGRPRLRNVDFVVDGETIRPDEVAIWVEDGVPEAGRAAFAARGYETVRMSGVRVGPVGFVRDVLPRLVAATRALARVARAERWWLEPVRVLVTESLVCAEATRVLRPRAYVVYNDLHPALAARTLALRAAGCASVSYQHTCSFVAGPDAWVPSYQHAFVVHDALVSWGPLHSDFFRRHPSLVDEIWEVGALWSEHARLVRETPALREHYAAALGAHLDDFEHVVGVFDDTLSPFFLDAPSLAAFYTGIARLACERPKVLFLCKPKLPLAQVEGGEAIALELTGIPNLLVLDAYFETGAVEGLCDLAVAACYTSPAVETLGAGRPAVYYDATDRLRDTFQRRLPGFVATSWDELALLVDSQLGTGVDADRFRGLEGFFDGLAITRLRDRLRPLLDG